MYEYIMVNKLDEIKELGMNIDNLAKQVDDLKDLGVDLRNIAWTVEGLKVIHGSLNDLVVKVDEIKTLGMNIDNLMELGEHIDDVGEKLNMLNSLDDASRIIADKIKDLQSLGYNIDGVKDKLDILEQLNIDLQQVAKEVDEVKTLHESIDNVAVQIDNLHDLGINIDNVAKTIEDLQSFKAQFEALASNLYQISERSKDINSTLGSIETAYNAKMDMIDGRLKNTNNEIKNVGTKITSLKEMEPLVDALTTKVADLKSLDVNITNLFTQVDELKNMGVELGRITSVLDQLKTIIEVGKVNTDTINYVNGLRDKYDTPEKLLTAIQPVEVYTWNREVNGNINLQDYCAPPNMNTINGTVTQIGYTDNRKVVVDEIFNPNGDSNVMFPGFTNDRLISLDKMLFYDLSIPNNIVPNHISSIGNVDNLTVDVTYTLLEKMTGDDILPKKIGSVAVLRITDTGSVIINSLLEQLLGEKIEDYVIDVENTSATYVIKINSIHFRYIASLKSVAI